MPGTGAEAGAKGWDWNGVLPYFRRLETDTDYTDKYHGSTGPITIRRIPRDNWDDFTNAVAKSSRGCAGRNRRFVSPRCIAAACRALLTASSVGGAWPPARRRRKRMLR